MIDKKGFCKILKSTYAGAGYTVVPIHTVSEDNRAWRRNEILVYGPTWAVRCDVDEMPGEAAVQIAADVGYLPMEPVKVQRGCLNQMVMEDAAAAFGKMLGERYADSEMMQKIPVIFRERWQLFQAESGNVYAIDTELLKLIDWKDDEPGMRMGKNGDVAAFTATGGTVYIAPGRFSGADRDRLRYIAALDWAGQIEAEDPVDNISLFDPKKNEPLTDPAE